MDLLSARRQLRTLAVDELKALVRGNVMSPGDWDVPADQFPAIKVRTGFERKNSLAKGAPQFNTTTTLEFQLAVSSATAEAAQDAIELLGLQVETALLTSDRILRVIQQCASVTSQANYSSDGSAHYAGLAMAFEFELFEHYDASMMAEFAPLLGLGITVDSLNVVDKSGTYEGSPFPASVLPAPRELGPDGRAEGGLNITF